MRIRDTAIDGAYLIELEPHRDERGFFARSFCERELATAGLETRFVQHNISFNERRGTLRGMHYQAPPHEEVKIVRVTAGRLWDVVVDLRTDSPTRGEQLGVELSAAARTALYVPAGLAHGFLTLEDATEVSYLMSAFYEPAAARGLRWDDPALGLAWPEPPTVISERDASYPDYPGAGR